jgi:NAD(P)-dependent dehydrogenase (short-subunit alcohol dehydrogenase family)
MSGIYADLSNQKILIIGGGSRMGLATAKLAANQGAEVIISGRSEDKLKKAAIEINQGLGVYAADASNPEEIQALLGNLQPIDHVVVTASSTEAPASSFPRTSPDIAQAAFKRLWICYNVLHFAPQHMNKQGSITLTSGSSAKTPVKGYGVWGALHGSINAFISQSAIELAPIRVNAVSPGGIGIHADRQLVERVGKVEDIAQMILAIITNPVVTSTIIDVDGGERLGTWSG